MDMTKIEELLSKLKWTIERNQRDFEEIQEQIEDALIQIVPQGDGKSNDIASDNDSDYVRAIQLIKKLVSEQVAPERIVERESASWCGVFLDNKRKTICRLYFSRSSKRIGIYTGRDNAGRAVLNEHSIDHVEDIKTHQTALLAACALYEPEKRRRRRHKSYEVLILEALVELDGRGTVDKVCELVEEKRGIHFKKHSCTARRAKMIRKGWLKDNLDTSTWEITDEGRTWLAEVG